MVTTSWRTVRNEGDEAWRTKEGTSWLSCCRRNGEASDVVMGLPLDEGGKGVEMTVKLRSTNAKKIWPLLKYVVGEVVLMRWWSQRLDYEGLSWW